MAKAKVVNLSSRLSAGDAPWADLPDDELLDWRLCDLDLRLEGSLLEARIGQVYRELEKRSIRFRPHFWLGDDWFTPDGVPGVAIPFYLIHPRLTRLERAQMLEVEGGARQECLRILRHETGHAIDNAYRLRRKKRRQSLFGRSSQPYPDYYSPRPDSKNYVLHLDSWYAQSHPDEDFAETFAEWLGSGRGWKRRYSGWPALRKLEYLDALMKEIAGRKPLVRSRRCVDPLHRARKTLRDHYHEKRERYQADFPKFYDRSLRRLFSSGAT
ncbi:MAG: putative zinc-binding metallopeptidase, partial [Acidobacteriota bacterium]